jgi:hypothetical protein
LFDVDADGGVAGMGKVPDDGRQGTSRGSVEVTGSAWNFFGGCNEN